MSAASPAQWAEASAAALAVYAVAAALLVATVDATLDPRPALHRAALTAVVVLMLLTPAPEALR